MKRICRMSYDEIETLCKAESILEELYENDPNWIEDDNGDEYDASKINLVYQNLREFLQGVDK